MKSFVNKKSNHVVEFEKKYCVQINDLKNVSKETGVPVKILKKVINKGMGAYWFADHVRTKHLIVGDMHVSVCTSKT